jgi:pyridoxal phosphate enzyme (YggS family)
VSELAQRFAAVHERIARACDAAGRDSAGVKLLAVSKFHPVAQLRAAYALGQREFGENYAQELVDKASELADLPGLRFRFIGGLQRNKLKLLAPLRCAIETLASESSAHALHERVGTPAVQTDAGGALAPVEVMLQVNTSDEPQKSGVAPGELPALLALVRQLSGLKVSGLMTIPKADDAAAARVSYRRLRELAQQHQLQELSMGMSDDLEIAIAEGATRVRLGTALFGPRPQR